MGLAEYLNIGFIQTVVEGDLAWSKRPDGSYPKRMSRISETRVVEEIRRGFIDLVSYPNRPDIIVLPELTVPLGYLYDLKKLCEASGAIVIAGLDFVWNRGKVSNKAIVCVPKNWPSPIKSVSSSFFYFGKTYFSKYEEGMYPGCLDPEPAMYILDADQFGKIGVAICSDFFDIERFVIYKGRIHHMLIIAHNMDTESYYFLTEAISRLVFCNVIICNTGEFGDSIAFSPKKEAHLRTIYRHKGMSLFSTQMVKLPVFSLDRAQQPSVRSKEYKSKPPGYLKR